MIVSVTCRHGTKEKIIRSAIERSLNLYASDATRARVVFDKENHQRNSEKLITCHLSLSLPGKPNIDIYERQPSAMQAFIRANERGLAQLTRRINRPQERIKRSPPVKEIFKEAISWQA